MPLGRVMKGKASGSPKVYTGTIIAVKVKKYHDIIYYYGAQLISNTLSPIGDLGILSLGSSLMPTLPFLHRTENFI